ncbi:MAG: hypothetical protein ACK4ZE_07790 [Sphingorhabdus sp.]
MKASSQARTAANALIPAIPAQQPLKAFKRQSAKRTYIGIRERNWIPNSWARQTTYLEAGKALDLIEAATHARIIGLPLNLSLCIHFDAGNLKPHYTAQNAIHYFWKNATKWLSRKGIPATFVWVLEHSVGNGRPNGTGLHVHILMHCPEQYQEAFSKLAETKWLISAGMDNRDPSTFDAREYRVRPTDHNRQAYFDNYKTALAYLLKGMDPNEALPKVTGDDRPFAQWLGIQDTLKPNLPISGRRMSRSQNITKTARDRYHAGQ